MNPEEVDHMVINQVINTIFDRYASKPGQLNRREAQLFIQDTMGNLASGEQILPEAFEDLFTSFDKDGNGLIEKPEMMAFIMREMIANQDESY